MRKELQDKLYEQFPKLYAQKDLDMQQTCMCWGICCGDGWYNIIEDLSRKLEPLGVEAVQVKEKFGGLRFYLNGYNETASKLINKAEAKSIKTCELCGKPGKQRGTSWVRILCDGCLEASSKNN